MSVIANGVPIATGTASADPVDGSFTATLPLNPATQVACGETVTIHLSCSSGQTCQTSADVVLTCSDCYRVEATVDLSQPCTGPANAPTKKVTIDADVGLPTGVASKDFYWDFGGGNHGHVFIATVTPTAPVFHHSETFVLPPGSYTATLKFATGTPENCIEYTISFPVDCPTFPPGGCPTVTVHPPSPAPCVNNLSTVTFSVDITATAQGAVAYWDYDGTGTFGPPIIVNAGATVNSMQAHNLPAGHYTAVLHISSPTGCPDVLVTFDVTCPQQPPPPCTLEILTLTVTPGDCDPATGKRLVTATATLNNSDPIDECWWQWDTNPATVGIPASPNGLTQTHLYDAPGTGVINETVSLTVKRGAHCQSVKSQPFPIDGCGSDCPQLHPLMIDANGPCTPDGTRRTITLDATIDRAPDEYVWDFGDGASQTLPGTSAHTTHDFAPGTWTVKLIATGPGDCSTFVQTQITVPPCCPQVTGISVSQAPCVKGTPTVEVTLTAQATGEPPSAVTWDFGDNSSGSGGLVQTHTYAPGTYSISVTLNAAGCPPTTFPPITVTVDPCSDTPPPTKTQIDLCTGLLWTAIIMAIVGSIALLVGCVLAAIPYTAAAGEIVEWVGLGLVATALVLFLLWWFFCRFITPCDVILTVRNVLLVMIVAFPVAALIVDFASGFALPCAIKQIVTFAYWGTVLLMVDWLARNRHCLIENPSGKPPPPASSSSALSGRDLTHVRADQGDTTDIAPLGTSPRAQALPVPQPATSAAMTAERPRPAGLGDVVKTVTSAIGIKPCEGCHKRAEQLNRAFPFADPGQGEVPQSD